MTDSMTPLRKQVDRSGYAFNLGVAATIEASGSEQRWRLGAVEVPWSDLLGKDGGFVDITIQRDRAIGVIECKKVNGEDQLVFLVKAGDTGNQTRCRLDVYAQVSSTPGLTFLQRSPRYGTAECTMATGSHESAYCAAPKGGQGANLNLDRIASELLSACEGLLGDWHIKLPGEPTACIPIVLTNARLYTCTYDPTAMDLGTGDIPHEADIKPAHFVRFRKAFRQGAGVATIDEKEIADAVAEGERTVFVVDTRHLIPFLGGLRGIYLPTSGGQKMLVSGD